jgi:hypothetical protein
MRRSFLSHCRSASLMLPVLTLAGGGGGSLGADSDLESSDMDDQF